MEVIAEKKFAPGLQTLPGDDVRQIMWRFADRYELHMLVQASRAVARGPVARVVADGGRNSHEWTPAKAGLLQHFDESGITAAALDPEEGGFIAGPKNLALALVAFELSWVDAGRPRAASPAIWVWRRFTSAERRNSAPNMSAAPRRSSRAKIASRSAPPLRSPNRSRLPG